MWKTASHLKELIGARVADANSTMERSGCSRYKYLSREREHERVPGASASRREGWSTSRRAREIMACTRVRAYAWIRTRSGKLSPVLERQKHLGRRRPACLHLSGEFCGKVVGLLPAFQSILRRNVYWDGKWEFSSFILTIVSRDNNITRKTIFRRIFSDCRNITSSSL